MLLSSSSKMIILRKPPVEGPRRAGGRPSWHCRYVWWRFPYPYTRGKKIVDASKASGFSFSSFFLLYADNYLREREPPPKKKAMSATSTATPHQVVFFSFRGRRRRQHPTEGYCLFFISWFPSNLNGEVLFFFFFFIV